MAADVAEELDLDVGQPAERRLADLENYGLFSCEPLAFGFSCGTCRVLGERLTFPD